MRFTYVSPTLVRTTSALLAGAALLLGAGVSHVSAAVGDLARPTNLTAAGLDGTSILVTWRDTNDAEEGYRLAYRAGSVGAADPAATYVDAPAVDGRNGNGFFTVRGLGPGTTYCFRVMAFHNGGATGVYHYSLFSEPVCAATVAPPKTTVGQPATPANFRGERDTIRTRIVLQWDDVSGETYFALSAASHVGQVPQRLAETPAMVGANSTTFIVDGAVSNAVTVAGGVDFELRACNPNGCSAPAKLILP
jgi:hypothetical protein